VDVPLREWNFDLVSGQTIPDFVAKLAGKIGNLGRLIGPDQQVEVLVTISVKKRIKLKSV